MDFLSDRYQIKHEIGSGGMGTVYLAFDSKLKRDVAVKKVHPHLLAEGAVRSRFSNEARAIASLSHENIVSLYDVGEETELFLIMEYITGKTLQQIMEDNPEVPNLIILEIGRQLFKGLASADEKNIVHRDIKPANIMLDKRGCLKITDFGVVHVIHQTFLTSTGHFLGTPQYISPEIVKGENISGLSDVFSAGCVLYHCVTGRLPFSGGTPHRILQCVCNEEPVSPVTQNSKTHPFIDKLLGKLLDKNPGNRPSAMEAAEMIENFCLENQMRMGMWRLKNFLADPTAYIESENREMYRHFFDISGIKQRAGKSAAAHRYLHLAGLFGNIDGIDIGAKQNKNGKHLKTGLIGSLIFLVTAALVLWIYLSPSEHTESPDQPVVSNAEQNLPSPVTASRDTARLDTSTAKSSQQAPRIEKMMTNKKQPVKKTDLKMKSVKRNTPGYLKVKTRPPFAKVFLNGSHLGQTPIKVPVKMMAGKYMLRIEKSGCEVLKKKIHIKGTDTLNLAFELQKI